MLCRCEIHGAVVGWVPGEYRILPGHGYQYGPFCPLCIAEWYAETFQTLEPISEPDGERQ